MSRPGSKTRKEEAAGTPPRPTDNRAAITRTLAGRARTPAEVHRSLVEPDRILFVAWQQGSTMERR